MASNVILQLATPPAQATSDPLVFDKEVAYEGTFTKGDFKFTIDFALMKHWAATFQDFIAEGIKVNVPVEHTTDPEKNRGHVLSLRVGENDKGKRALFALLRFRDQDAAKLAKTTDVSLYSPPDYKSGSGKTYRQPILHIALTDYPVIPGLAPFKAIVASLTENTEMTFLELAKSIEGLEVPEDATEESAAELIKAHIEAQAAKIAELGGNAPKPGETPPASNTAVTKVTTIKETPIAASMIGILRENRETKLGTLVSAGKITPKVAAQLKSQYVTDEGLKLSLSGTGHDDGFDAMVKALSLNDAIVPTASKAGVQTLPASGGALMKDAERRAAEAK